MASRCRSWARGWQGWSRSSDVAVFGGQKDRQDVEILDHDATTIGTL